MQSGKEQIVSSFKIPNPKASRNNIFAVLRSTRKQTAVQLKSIEIKGFKSFPDKTIVHFNQNITGIVGPNGCGKSNIVDAIRWVIGEQKMSALRSENLENLIFNGSKNRAASGLAEVGLTFENTKNILPTEFNTITITRRFYRSNESEYRLNDVVCRLKDIQNLLLDTGISNDTYAIIELGMIDEIIKDKDNSRRRMLEQAAGISIYKVRKKETKSKLESTDNDLNRIEDILFEIQNQLKLLDAQAQKTKRYLDLKAEYKVQSIKLAQVSLKSYTQNLSDYNQRLESKQQQLMELKSKIAFQEAKLEKEKLQFIEREQQLRQLQQEFNQSNQLFSDTAHQTQLLQQQAKHLQERLKNQNEFVTTATQQQSSFEHSLQHTHTQLEEEKQLVENIAQQLQQQQLDYTQQHEALLSLRNRVLESRVQLQKLQQEQHTEEKQLAVIETNSFNLKRNLQQNLDERQTKSKQVQQAQEQVQELKLKQEATQTHLLQEEGRMQQIKTQILEEQNQQDQLLEKHREVVRIADAKKNEFALLQSMVNNMEGYPDSVKFLHQQASWKPTPPVLSDILTVNEEYKLGVERLLDNYLNYYVVQNEAQAHQAIHLLQSNQKGKAGFFILDCVPAAQAIALRDVNGLKPALEVVESKEPYQGLIQHLLRNVYLSDKDEMNQTVEVGISIVHTKGLFVKGQLEIHGGSVGSFEGMRINRKHKLEQLEHEIGLYQTQIQTLVQQIDALRTSVLGKNKDLNNIQLQDIQKQIASLEARYVNRKHILHTHHISRWSG